MKPTKILLPLALAASGLLLSASGAGADEEAEARLIRHQRVFYPMSTCPVSGEELGEGAQDVVRDGRLIRFCCGNCVGKFDAAPDEYVAKLDAAVIRAQEPGYAVEKCVVSGEALGSMGDPISIVHQNRLVKLCCKGCKKGFKRDAEGMMAKLDEAMIAAKVASYPMDKCLVSGEALGSMGEPVDKLYGTELVRFCCKGCIKGFEKKPHEFLSKLHGKAGRAHGEGHGAQHGKEHGAGHGAGHGGR